MQATEGYRLSPQQRRVWSLERESESSSFRSQCLIEITGRLNKNGLLITLSQLIERHELLRTAFHRMDEKSLPLQVISDSQTPQIEELDWSEYPSSEQKAEIETLCGERRQRSLDYESDRLFDLSLIKLSSEKHYLLITLPALLADEETLCNSLIEIAGIYEAVTRGDSLVEMPLQYIELSEWQQFLLETDGSEKGKKYWARQELQIADLSSLRAERSPARLFTPQYVVNRLDPEALSKIDTIIGTCGVPRSVYFLTCWVILLWRFTRQNHITVGIANNGRNIDEVSGALGLLTKFLPLTIELSGEHTFNDCLTLIGDAVRQNEKWQQFFSWDRVTAPSGDSTGPFFLPVSFNHTVFPPEQHAGVVTFSIAQLYSCIERFQIKLGCVETTGATTVEFHFDSASVREEEIVRLAGQYLELLNSAAVEPDAKLSELELIGAAERELLLQQFNTSEHDVPETRCIHQLFVDQVNRDQGRIAVGFENEELTYAELNARANQLARYLQEYDIGPDCLVGICLERSIEMIVGVLGVLKAGAAYVPIDPAYPEERIAFMLDDAQVPVLLSQTRFLDALPAHEGKTICLDQVWEEIVSKSTAELACDVEPENLAYVIYTSGSTGTPKGVMITRRSLVNLACSQAREFGITPESCVLQFASLSFDASVSEIFTALLSGSRLCLARREDLLPGRGLSWLMREQGVTVVTLPPSVLAVMQDENISGLQTLVSAGEACSAEMAQSWRGRVPRMINAYGPTEATVCATLGEIGASKLAPSIGRPMANARIYVLDERQQLAPIGVEGEIYIGGLGVGRGYLKRPELTAEKFVPDPYGEKAGGRLYRSGDRGRWLANGDLEYLGRADQQVKIRGYRVELGEIEWALSQHKAVKEAAVVGRGEGGVDYRLIAYVCPEPTSALTIGELRNYLRNRLPEYMLPQAFVRLDAMPLTANGKLDRNKLLEKQPECLEEWEFEIDTRTPIESLLTAIWCEVLGAERINPDDDFFDLGGHSLLATQIIAGVCKTFNVDIEIPDLFEAPTIATFARIVEQACQAAEEVYASPIAPVGRNQPLPPSFSQERLWFFDQLNRGNALYNLNRSIRLRGSLNLQVLGRTLCEIVRRHEAFRTSFESVDGKLVQVIADDVNLKLPLIDLTHYPEHERERAAVEISFEESRQPFNLAAGPLLRVVLFRLGPNDYVLHFTLHHIISDGWSLGVLVREVAMLYEAFIHNHPSPLSGLALQYADFAAWQRELLQGDILANHLHYWKKQLAGIPLELQLPRDFPRPAVQSYRGGRHYLKLSKPTSDSLHAISRNEKTTIFMTLLAAFKVLLHYYGKSDDIVVGTDVANRRRAETDNVIGLFVNQLVLRTKLSGDLTFQELLGQVRKTCLEAYLHQDLPFDRLVEVLNPLRDLGRNPLFQVMFGFHNAPPPVLNLYGLMLESLNVKNAHAMFELSLYMIETPQGLAGTWTYHTDLFKPSTVCRMSDDYERLLDQIVSDPAIKLKKMIAFLTAINEDRREKQQQKFIEARRQKLGNARRKRSVL